MRVFKRNRTRDISHNQPPPSSSYSMSLVTIFLLHNESDFKTALRLYNDGKFPINKPLCWENSSNSAMLPLNCRKWWIKDQQPAMTTLFFSGQVLKPIYFAAMSSNKGTIQIVRDHNTNWLATSEVIILAFLNTILAIAKRGLKNSGLQQDLNLWCRDAGATL